MVMSGLWRLAPLTTIFLLYRGQFIVGRNWSTQRKPLTHLIT